MTSLPTWNFEQDDNFTQVTVANKQLLAQTFNRDGKLRRSADLTLA